MQEKPAEKWAFLLLLGSKNGWFSVFNTQKPVFNPSFLEKKPLKLDFDL